MSRLKELERHATTLAEALEYIGCERVTKDYREYLSTLRTNMPDDNMEQWLIYIKDITMDRDGLKSVKDLGGLIDEIHDWAYKALTGEPSPYRS